MFFKGRIFTIFEHPLMNDGIIPFIFHGKYTVMHKLFILQKTMHKIFRFPCLFINSGQTLCIVTVCNGILFVKIIYNYSIEPCQNRKSQRIIPARAGNRNLLCRLL